jgi:hypothetical protein
MKGFSLLMVTLLLFGCAKEYVGKTVDYRRAPWCELKSLPRENCTQTDDWMTITYELERKGNNTLLLNGKMQYHGPSSFSRLSTRSHPDYPPSRFMLILAKRGVIVDQIAFTPQSDSLQGSIAFERQFEVKQPFDAALIYWQATVTE